jgi:hypothetical protein
MQAYRLTASQQTRPGLPQQVDPSNIGNDLGNPVKNLERGPVQVYDRREDLVEQL